DAFWSMKNSGRHSDGGNATRYAPISVPQHSPMGFLIAFFSVILGFALIWHIWWMAVLGLATAVAVMLVHSWRLDTENEISAQEIAEIEGRRHAQKVSA
ncbi:MAG: cytochrome o ubiquinol oxidase subunit I, partial [Steroidobacteraceae bacterium]